MYCTKCGKKNAEDRLFCGFCGSPLNTPEAAAPEDDERRIYGRPGTGQAQTVAAPEKGGEETAPEQAVPRSRRARHASRPRWAARRTLRRVSTRLGRVKRRLAQPCNGNTALTFASGRHIISGLFLLP